MKIETLLRIVICLASVSARLAAAADFDGDGRQDLVWRDHAGHPVIWQMNGTAVSARATLATGADAGAAIVGSGRFFGAAPDAIAWVDSSRRLSLWRVAGGVVQQSCVVASGIDAGWTFLGIGDLNADGFDDVAWRLPDGSVTAYLMNGCAAPRVATLGAQADPTWTFAGIGSVDAVNGAVFWRTTAGDVVLWRLHNGTAVFSNTLKAGTFANWSLVAAADFDGDHRTDLLWRDGSGQQAALWLLNGTKVTTATVAPLPRVFAAPDALFTTGFDSAAQPSPPLSAAWTAAAAADFNGDGFADIAWLDAQGNCAIWQMQGASIVATGLIPAGADMPYTAGSGWRMRMGRPLVTKTNGTVSVAWTAVSGAPAYTVYASATNDPSVTGTPVSVAASPLSFNRSDIDYADKRYFAVSAGYLGVQLPASKEAYIVEFSAYPIPQWGALAIGDINNDGCLDLLDALGDCHGNFQTLGEGAMGLGALRANGRAYRDVRYADFDGDGVEDIVSNVYSSIDDPGSQVLLFRGTGNNHYVEDAAFTALDIRGYGETIVVADFNNDGYLDIYLPQYSMDSPAEHSWLLLNDGSGHFTDVSDLTGLASDPDANIALRAVPDHCRVEAAQAVDLNNDGRIDLYVGNRLFLNQGNDAAGVPHFLDAGPRTQPSNFDPASMPFYDCTLTAAAPTGLPLFHDEGAKFIDLDNSGQLSLVLNSGASSEAGGEGIGVFKFDGLGQFADFSDAVPHFYMISVWA